MDKQTENTTSSAPKSGKLDPRHAVYVGSFDPVTLGHVDIIRRGVAIFDQLTIGIGLNPDKQSLFDQSERLNMLKEIFAKEPHVRIETFDGLTVQFTRKCGAGVLLRGVRSLMDIELELTMSLTNSTLAPELETVFLMAHEKYSHISSTLIKQIARFGGPEVEEKLCEFVPAEVVSPLIAKYHP
ncbi:pantetheine-phosphate adenylyltransferase [Calycomorphotria hydatis]|uniref:Phosphopantetheine adenylyltransferase n=1 Tax=Calycomorphotria hydatis TaxID=2528027 RepID=A0A517T9Q6_9PLAN|nr:pantetheine-phosphate adenylyltransferase [Calycomorphotria hydatis]QDT65089.1 Phosphopantetheine adenylyltransferase [Calycomorphotria hydatis]